MVYNVILVLRSVMAVFMVVCGVVMQSKTIDTNSTAFWGFSTLGICGVFLAVMNLCEIWLT